MTNTLYYGDNPSRMRERLGERGLQAARHT